MELLLIIAIVAGVVFVLRMVRQQMYPVSGENNSVAAPGTSDRTGMKVNKHAAVRTSIAVAGTGAAVLTAAVAAAAYARSGCTRSDDWLKDPIYWFMAGNIYYREQFDDDSLFTSANSGGDWYTSPIYSWMPGNIYYHDTSFSSIDSGFSTTDYITDPVYSYMPGNIFNHDDSMDISNLNNDISCGSSSNFDDSWSSSSNSTDNDWNSTSNSFNDDD